MVQDNEKRAEMPVGPTVAELLVQAAFKLKRDAFNPDIGIIKRADNFMRTTANFITFGLADVAAGTLNKNLLSSSSCSTTLLCIDEELKRTNNVKNETPLEYFAGATVGSFLNAKAAMRMLPKSMTVGQRAEHFISVAALNQFINHYLKPKFAEELIFDPPVSDSEITAPSVPNLVKELTGQKAPPVNRR